MQVLSFPVRGFNIPDGLVLFIAEVYDADDQILGMDAKMVFFDALKDFSDGETGTTTDE